MDEGLDFRKRILALGRVKMGIDLVASLNNRIGPWTMSKKKNLQ